MARDFAVNVKGLADLRRDLRAVDRDALREVQAALKQGAQLAADEAARLAPRRTGALAASYRPFTSGNRAGVRSNLPYAPVIEYGGTIRPRGAAILFRRSEPVTRAVVRQTDRIVETIADGIEEAARNHGWR